MFPFFRAFESSLTNVFHRQIHAAMVFLGSQHLEICFGRDFEVHAQTVGIQSGFAYQFPAGSGDAFQVNIAVETMNRTQVFCHPHQTFHGVIGITYHTRAQEQSLDIVPAVKLHGQVHQFAHRQSGTRYVVADTVDTIGTIVYAVVGKHDLEQRNAPAVFGKAMADTPPSYGISYPAGGIAPYGSAGRARYIVFGRLCQYLEFMQDLLVHLYFTPIFAVV